MVRGAAAAAALAALMLATGCAGESENELLASAKTYAEKNDHQAAIIQLKSALQRNPNSGEARLLLGQQLVRAGDLRSAVVELEKAADLKYDDNRVLPLLAKTMVGLGQLKRVTDLYSRVDLDEPRAAAELQATVAAAFGALGQFERSQAAVDKALRSDPKNPVARLVEARLAAGRGEIDKAMTLIDALLVDAPGKREALHLKGDLLWGGKRDLEGAAKAYRDALSSDPRYLPAHNSLLTLLLGMRDLPTFKAQVAELQKALPGIPDARFYEAQVALLDGNITRSRELTQHLLKIAPDNVRVLQLAGAIESRGGSLLLAETHLTKALQIDPSQQNARQILAEVLVRTGQPGRAVTVLDPLMQQRPTPAVLALAAEAHLQDGNLSQAEALFKRAALVNPDDPKIRTALALTQISRGNASAGFAELESVAAKDASAYADLALISALMRRGDTAAALKAIDRLQVKLADKPLPYHLRAAVMTQRSDASGARGQYLKALEIDPDYFPATAGLATMDLREGKPEEARKRLDALLARDPKNLRALIAIAELKQRVGAPRAEIAAALSDAIRANPQDLTARLMLVEHSLDARDFKAALTAAQEALATARDDPRALQALGRAQLAAGEVQQAIATLGRLANSQPRLPGPHLLLADALLQSGDKAGAEASLRRALEMAPGLPAAITKLWQIAMIDKRYEQALRIARQMQQSMPAEPTGFLLEADTLAAQLQFDPAIAATRAALQRRQATSSATRMHGLLILAGRKQEAERFATEWLRANAKDAAFVAHLGALALDRKDYARAEALYRQVLTLLPDNITALNNIAWTMTMQVKPGAAEFAERANVLAPEQPAIMDTLSGALAAEGQIAKAVEWQRKAIAKAPDAPVYRLHLAEILLQAGDKAGAKTELEALKKLGDKFAAGQKRVDELLRTL